MAEKYMGFMILYWIIGWVSFLNDLISFADQFMSHRIIQKLVFTLGFSISRILLPAQDEPMHFSHLTRLNGLPSNRTRCVIQDFQGYVWIGTDNGLVRFDGRYLWSCGWGTGLNCLDLETGTWQEREGRPGTRICPLENTTLSSRLQTAASGLTKNHPPGSSSVYFSGKPGGLSRWS